MQVNDQQSSHVQTILVVDDEPLLRLHALDMVEEAGFVAIDAANADEAVAILEARDDIVLLFTDVKMPGTMDGVMLAHAVKRRWPPIKIIVVSGHLRCERAGLPDDCRFFGKPYETSKMITELQTMLS